MDRLTSRVFGGVSASGPTPTADLVNGPRGESLTLTLDVTDEEQLTQDALDRADRVADELTALDARIRDFLVTDVQTEESAANLYLIHHLEELDPDALCQSFGTADVQRIGPDLLVDRLRIRHISFQPDGDGDTLIFDYSLDAQLTDYVLAVQTDDAGVVESVQMES